MIFQDLSTDQQGVRKNFDIVQENTPKSSKRIHFLSNEKLSLNQSVWRDHATTYATGYFVASLTLSYCIMCIMYIFQKK